MIYLFGGPSIYKFDEKRCTRAPAVDIRFLPPAQAGDIKQVVGQGATVIILVDGVFLSHRPPWHREILDAIDIGITVVGCASMGAIRAAELSEYGMIESGEIATRYVNGARTLPNVLVKGPNDRASLWAECVIQEKVFCDDDDVALLYAGEELRYMPYTLPMVNFVISFEEIEFEYEVKKNCLQSTKAIHYSNRTWRNVEIVLKEKVLPMYYEKKKVDMVFEKIRSSYIDQKTIDSLALIDAVLQGEVINSACAKYRPPMSASRMYDELL